MKTTGQMEEARQRYWGEDRNRYRRERYAQDSAYREQAKRHALLAHRKRTGKVPTRVDFTARVKQFGEVRDIRSGRVTQKVRCFTLKELGEVLQRAPSGISKWIKDEWIYPPRAVATFQVPVGAGARMSRPYEAHVYLEDEVRAMAEVLTEHFATRLNLNRRDVGVFTALKRSMDRAYLRRKK